jgi:hypothetical protein
MHAASIARSTRFPFGVATPKKTIASSAVTLPQPGRCCARAASSLIMAASSPDAKPVLTFVTGNPKKLEEVKGM